MPGVSLTSRAKDGERLLAVPTSGAHREIVAAMVERFRPQFDVWLFVWDGSLFESSEFRDCHVIHVNGYNKWDFARDFLAPDIVREYEFLFVWDDDLNVTNFDPDLFLAVMSHNRLEMAQPALSRDSYFSHRITLQRQGIGRLTDFVEVMAPVWTRAAWPAWYKMLTPDNPWGWGYDLAAHSACGYERMGIVDCTTVRHSKPFTRLPKQFADMRQFFADHPDYEPCRGRVYGALDAPRTISTVGG